MADLSKKEGALEGQEQSSGLINKGKVTLAAAVLAVGLSTSVQANDLLKQCDFNKNGAIDTAEMYGIKSRAEYRDANPKIKDIITREQKCETDFSIAQKDASIKKLDEEDKRFNQILAMLDKDELRRALLSEVKKTEDELKKEKDKIKREKLLIRLDILKGKLKELDKNVA